MSKVGWNITVYKMGVHKLLITLTPVVRIILLSLVPSPVTMLYLKFDTVEREVLIGTEHTNCLLDSSSVKDCK